MGYLLVATLVPSRSPGNGTRAVTRFPSRHHFASFTGIAPLEASSGDVVRHRLNRLGNRQLNRALHVAAVVQLAHDPRGRAYERKKAPAREAWVHCAASKIS